jgi:hypothetical protein
MRKAFLALIMSACFILAAAAQAEGVKWVKDFSSAMTMSKSSGKLVMVDFYTDW